MKQFNSQICTTREQSKRLIALGLKPETADMLHSTIVVLDNMVDLISAHVWIPKAHVTDDWFPAWSLHRLIEMIGDMFEMQHWLGFNIEKDYDHTIDCIEWLIEDNRFNKEYLV